MNFTKTFMSKTYKQKKEKLLFEREKAMLPETQQRMEEEKKRQEFNRNTTRLNLLINEKRAMIRRLGGGSLISVTDQELRRRWTKELEELVRKLENLYRENNVEKKEEEKVEISRIACSKEDCRGFLNKEDNRLRCGMCNTIHCNKCRVETNGDDEHKCNKDTLETIKMLEKDTKPCPKCSVPIFKIEGCDQMWCTKCHTAFSWKKGTIETGHVHNPHYWKYLQENGRDLDQVRRMNGQRVGGVPQCQDLRDMVVATRNQHLGHISQLIHHFQFTGNANYNQENNADGNYDLRKSYLNKEIDDKKFVRVLHMRYKKKLFDKEMNQISRMFVDTSKDILLTRINQLGRLNLNVNDFEDCYEEINRLAVYAKEQIEELYKRYKYTFCRVVNYALTSIIKYTRTKQIKHYYEEETNEDDTPLAQLERLRI
jgi:hypothetical protein